MEDLEELNDATRWLVEEAEFEIESIKKVMNGEPVAEQPPRLPKPGQTTTPPGRGLGARLSGFLPALLKA
jgi:hypothetical protein